VNRPNEERSWWVKKSWLSRDRGGSSPHSAQVRHNRAEMMKSRMSLNLKGGRTCVVWFNRRQSPRFASRVEASGKMGGPQSARARNLPPRLLLELRVVPNLANPKERQQVTLPA
jgi:hypothetical protein